MPMILFAPAVFNLAETTRMIEVAKQMQGNHHCEFFGFSKTFASLIIESGFTYHCMSISIFLLSMVGKGLFKQLVPLGSRLSESGCTMSKAAIFSTAWRMAMQLH
ncbi:glycosyl transferase [Enterococcus sp. AZ154]